MLTCPNPRCRSESALGSATCDCCGLPLEEVAALRGLHARLFNRGLEAAKAGKLGDARDLFSAVVEWCPHDSEARNALALAAFHLGDREAARRHWSAVAARAATNPMARTGLAVLESLPAAAPAIVQAPPTVPAAEIIRSQTKPSHALRQKTRRPGKGRLHRR